jgi:hypothetical protein
MITITKDFETIKTIDQLKDVLLEIINDEIEAYGEDSGYFNKTDHELREIVDKYLTEVTMEEINIFKENCDYEDVEEAIMCYLNEWNFVD